MFVPDARWYLGTSWILLVVVIGVTVGTAGNLLLLAVGAIVPPLIMLALWHKAPTLTVAEVLHTKEK